MRKIEKVSSAEFIKAMTARSHAGMLIPHGFNLSNSSLQVNAHHSALIGREVAKEKNKNFENIVLLGIDYSASNVGLALGDLHSRLANPYKTIKRKFISNNSEDMNLFKLKRHQADLDVIRETMQEVISNNVQGIIIGYPFELDGTQGPACNRVDNFISRLLKACSSANHTNSQYDDLINNNEDHNKIIKLALWDERLSTQTVRHRKLDKFPRKQKSKSQSSNRIQSHLSEDARAAAFILQGMLDIIAEEADKQ